MSTTIQTPSTHPSESKVSIFLAGSIENGVADQWQSRVADKIAKEFDQTGANVIINNPRNDDWDTTIDPSVPSPELVKQINWELDQLDQSDIIIMYFDKNTKSPISLLELGLYKDRNIFVLCPNEFWRSVNVGVTCERFNIPLYYDEQEMVNDVVGNIASVLERRGW